MEKFTTQDIKEFFKDVVLAKWAKEGKLKKRPISYTLTKYKEDKKRTYSYSVKLSELMIADPILKSSIEFKINTKTFKCLGYDFSIQWQNFLATKENNVTV